MEQVYPQKAEKALEALALGLTGGISLPWAVTKDWKRWLLLHMQRQQYKTPGNMKNQGNMTPPKDHKNFPITDHKNFPISDPEDMVIFQK